MQLKKIKNIKKQKYNGIVYDLSVDENFTYNINGIIVHNSMCTTRIQTGHGIPNVTSIEDCLNGSRFENGNIVPIMADGGIRTSGDISKAIAVGAETVMLGSLLAGTHESPSEIMEYENQLFKKYRGSASLDTKTAHNQKIKNVEGVSTIVPYKGGVKYVINRLKEGLQSALSYSGANDINEYHAKVDWVEVSNAGIKESTPHGLNNKI